MALVTNGWFPDTCTCVLEYSYDTTSTAAATYTVVKKGAEHGTLSGTAHALAVLDENGRKNQMLGIAANVLGTGIVGRYSWSFNLNRTLLVSFNGTNISGPLKTQVQNAADLQYGPGKVVVS